MQLMGVGGKCEDTRENLVSKMFSCIFVSCLQVNTSKSWKYKTQSFHCDIKQMHFQ